MTVATLTPVYRLEWRDQGGTREAASPAVQGRFPIQSPSRAQAMPLVVMSLGFHQSDQFFSLPVSLVTSTCLKRTGRGCPRMEHGPADTLILDLWP